MCVTCGCGKPNLVMAPEPRASQVIKLERRLLDKNDRFAAENRAWLAARGILALNLVSSPGAGKTTLLTRTIADWRGPVHVVEGDQATSRDADKIRQAGARAVQINTGTGCHLEAEMVQRALGELEPEPGALVMIENVGNLVCPALFDLGEHAKVVILSVTEGDDKPLKYPHMFGASALMVVTKIDLLPYVEFDMDAAVARAREIQPAIEVLALSAKTGEGLEGWYRWLEATRARVSC